MYHKWLQAVGYSLNILQLHTCAVRNVLLAFRELSFIAIFSGSYFEPDTSGILRSRKPKLTDVGIRCADHGTPSIS
jgi:hypothetical protein